ncbi:hypothetical protein EON63_16140, partial [archaeon]
MSLSYYTCSYVCVYVCVCIYNTPIYLYIQTWEEYYSGHMILPPFNGASEGLTMCEIVSLLAFFKGSAWFHEVCKCGYYPCTIYHARHYAPITITHTLYIIHHISPGLLPPPHLA